MTITSSHCNPPTPQYMWFSFTTCLSIGMQTTTKIKPPTHSDLKPTSSGSLNNQLAAGYLCWWLITLMSKWWGIRSEMVIRPGLLMRSREDQPCVQRCFGTSPPLFLQCYCFFFSLIVSCAKAAHRQEQDKTPICITLHSSFLTATSLCLISILSWSVYCVVCVLSILHSFTPTPTCSPVWFFALSSSDRKARDFFPPLSLFFGLKKHP